MEDLCFRYKQEKKRNHCCVTNSCKSVPTPKEIFFALPANKKGKKWQQHRCKEAFCSRMKGSAPSSLLKWKWNISPDSAMTKTEDSLLLLKPPNSDSALEWHTFRNCKLSVATHLRNCALRLSKRARLLIIRRKTCTLHVTSKAVRTNYVRRACLIRRWLKRRLESLPLVMCRTCCATSNRALQRGFHSGLLNDLQMSQMWDDWITAVTDKLPSNQQQHDHTEEF